MSNHFQEFDSLTVEHIQRRNKVHEICRQFSRSPSKGNLNRLKSLFRKSGKEVFIESGFNCDYGDKISLGDRLSSSSITHFHWYYTTIRLPARHLSFSLYYRLADILSSMKDLTGSPGLPIILLWSTCHALRPRGAENHLHSAILCFDFR